MRSPLTFGVSTALVLDRNPVIVADRRAGIHVERSAARNWDSRQNNLDLPVTPVALLCSAP